MKAIAASESHANDSDSFALIAIPCLSRLSGQLPDERSPGQTVLYRNIATPMRTYWAGKSRFDCGPHTKIHIRMGGCSAEHNGICKA